MASGEKQFGGIGQNLGFWPVLVALVAAAVIPAGCVLWFMTAAMRNETLAAREQIAEVYREQLRLAQVRVDAVWKERAERIRDEKGRAAAVFWEMVTKGGADAVLVYCPGGELRYPVLETALSPMEMPAEWDAAVAEEEAGEYGRAVRRYEAIAATDDARVRALALVAEGRCELLAGRKERAREVLAKLASPRLMMQRDAMGRLVALDALLQAVRLAADDSLLRRVAEVASDYSVELLSAQRCLVLRELGAEYAVLANAETLALEAAEAKPLGDGAGLVRLKGDVWTLGRPGDGVVGVYRESTVRAQTLEAVNAAGTFAGARVVLRCEGERLAEEKGVPVAMISAGTRMPGWSLAVYLEGADPLLAAGRQQRMAYAWSAGVAIAAIMAGAAWIGMYLNRQLRLTRLKNDLIATVSHELKTPLASSRVLLETLLDGKLKDPRQQREYLKLIAKENQRLGRLIDSFLTFSRMERNRRAFVMTWMAPACFVEPAIEAVRERFCMPGARLSVKMGEGLPEVKVDREAMETVVINLLDNAWKYTRDEKQMELRVLREGEELCIEVADNGIGLSARQAARVFERFYQVDQSLSRRVGGCGLGLSIVKFIVEAHGGRVGVQSEKGVGSTFTVWLPAGKEH